MRLIHGAWQCRTQDQLKVQQLGPLRRVRTQQKTMRGAWMYLSVLYRFWNLFSVPVFVVVVVAAVVIVVYVSM